MFVPKTMLTICFLGATSVVFANQENEPQQSDQFQIHIDAAHPWRPPFGLDRVGRPLTVEVESRYKLADTGKFFLEAYRDGKVIDRQRVSFRLIRLPLLDVLRSTTGRRR